MCCFRPRLRTSRESALGSLTMAVVLARSLADFVHAIAPVMGIATPWM